MQAASLDNMHLGSSCAQAQARGRLPPLQSSLPSPVRTLVRQFLRQQDLSRLRRRDVCKQRWLYYRGDENYGLGNVLYDVASAAAIAMVLNRSIVYGANSSDRKFGSLLRWPGIPTLKEVEASRRWARCGPLSGQRHVMLEPDKCTFHKRWRMERTHLRCFRRLLGVDWLQDRAPIMELSKVHAFTGVQVFLKSISPAIRAAAASLTHGCVPEGLTRPNLFGPLLSALMRPAPAVLHALRWALSRAAGPSGHVTPQVAAAGGGRKWRPRVALHIRTMSGHRARNLTQRERSRRLANGVMCLRRELSRVAAADASRAASVGVGMPGVGIAAPASASSEVRPQGGAGMPIGVLVSSSPEGRDAVQQRLQRGGDDNSGSEGGEGGQGGTAKAAALLVFDWRLFLAEAPEHTVLTVSIVVVSTPGGRTHQSTWCVPCSVARPRP